MVREARTEREVSEKCFPNIVMYKRLQKRQ